MFGFLEAGRVVHVISREGCYTEIQPRLATSVHDIANPSFFAAIGLSLLDLTENIREAYTGPISGNSITPDDLSASHQDEAESTLDTTALGLGATIGIGVGVFTGIMVGSTVITMATASLALVMGVMGLWNLVGRDANEVQVFIHPVTQGGVPFIGDLGDRQFPTYMGVVGGQVAKVDTGWKVFRKWLRDKKKEIKALGTFDTTNPLFKEMALSLLKDENRG